MTKSKDANGSIKEDAIARRKYNLLAKPYDEIIYNSNNSELKYPVLARNLRYKCPEETGEPDKQERMLVIYDILLRRKGLKLLYQYGTEFRSRKPGTLEFGEREKDLHPDENQFYLKGDGYGVTQISNATEGNEVFRVSPDALSGWFGCCRILNLFPSVEEATLKIQREYGPRQQFSAFIFKMWVRENGLDSLDKLELENEQPKDILKSSFLNVCQAAYEVGNMGLVPFYYPGTEKRLNSSKGHFDQWPLLCVDGKWNNALSKEDDQFCNFWQGIKSALLMDGPFEKHFEEYKSFHEVFCAKKIPAEKREGIWDDIEKYFNLLSSDIRDRSEAIERAVNKAAEKIEKGETLTFEKIMKGENLYW